MYVFLDVLHKKTKYNLVKNNVFLFFCYLKTRKMRKIHVETMFGSQREGLLQACMLVFLVRHVRHNILSLINMAAQKSHMEVFLLT